MEKNQIMKRVIILSLVIFTLPLFTKAKNQDWKIDYCNKESIFVNRRPIDACHIVEAGETLWGLAEKYYGSGFEWKKLQYYNETMRPNKYPENPRYLTIGSKLVVWRAWEVGDAKNEVAGWGIDYKNGDVYTTGSALAAEKIIYRNDEIYDGPFSWLHFFTIDSHTNNKVYVASTKEDGRGKYRFIFNKERNLYVGPGSDFGLLTFNPAGDYYAVRTIARQDDLNPGFIVLSNIGNGTEYDFSDSLIWYNNDTLIYRAQNNDEWRVVVNHKDYKVFDYLENLRVENDVIKFDARSDDGLWTHEEFTLKI